MKWIIVDTRKYAALYGVGGKTLSFSSKEIALEVANQFFENEDFFMLVSVTGW